MYADVHLHLYGAASPEKLVSEAREGSVNLFISAGEDVETSRKCVELTRLEGVFAAVGVHPSHARIEPAIEKLIGEGVVAIGEIGLDEKYEKFGVPLERQREAFEFYLRLAEEYGLPVVVHTGRSYREALDILLKYDVPVLLHWYSGSVSSAVEAVEHGFYFSFGPAILKYKSYEALLSVIPLKNMMTETDFPVRVGGRENHPIRVVEVAKKIAEVKGLPLHETVHTLYKNARHFFHI